MKDLNSAKHIIIRRENRTYYSKVLKKQMTLSNISELIKLGEDLMVLNANMDGEDITTKTLIKIAFGVDYPEARDSRNREKIDIIMDVLAMYLPREEIEEAISNGGFKEYRRRVLSGNWPINKATPWARNWFNENRKNLNHSPLI